MFVSEAGTELLDLLLMMDGEVEQVMAFRLPGSEEVLLRDRLLEVQYANLYDCVPLETTGDIDGEEILPLPTDEMGTVDNIMPPEEDGGTLGISAMEYTGKLVRETLQSVTAISETDLLCEDDEVSEGDSPDNTILFLGLISERIIFSEVETVGKTILLLEADDKFDLSDVGRLKMLGNSQASLAW